MSFRLRTSFDDLTWLAVKMCVKVLFCPKSFEQRGSVGLYRR